ncbi:1-acylglycerol-3-phosphate O-acyltransferase [Coelomomyces lativittatus]|nr:1-acylglycerol-3-phosphate O-acyltransferase [Coelomomyces lativittatus]KAJ1502347.1 1-acylglycerol-3-phosphate O-acyltransferase [Coelomomyces lativittatus]KAJ1516826.1 1-acylglycerol-3-phosphate O-acyltransferase [Coelomomyces lativittatus]
MLSLIILMYIVLSLWSRLNLLLPSTLVFLLKASQCTLVLMLVSLLGIPLSLVFSNTSRRYDAIHYISWSFYWLCSYLLGIHVHLDGFKLTQFHGQAIYLANHQSSFDTFVLGALFPKRCSVLAKKTLRNTPIIGQFLQLAHTIFIDRENHESAMKTMKESSEKLVKEKLSLFVFPEGTRSRRKDRSLLPFKKGAFHLAVQSQLPIIPIVVSNYEDIYDSENKCFNSGTIHVRVLEPILTTNMTKDDIDLLIKKTGESMSQALKEISPPLTKTS